MNNPFQVYQSKSISNKRVETITKDEFEWLLKSQQDLIALKALQGAGLSKIKINNIKNTIIKTIFQTVILSL